MKIQKIPTNKINPAVYNPRIDLNPGDAEYEKLKRSITEFGYIEPLVWNERTGTLVSGHQRFKILIEQGAQEVEVSVVDLPITKEKALNLALNKIRGDWDEDKLNAILTELTQLPDFDTSLTGFDLPEISSLLDQDVQNREDDFDFDAEVESITEPITKHGDLIELGEHRILCGDSASEDDLRRLLSSEQVHLLHTDPPYNVQYYGGNRPNPKARPKKSRHWERIYHDNLSQDEYETWLGKIFRNVAPSLAEGACLYVWNGHRQFGPMHKLLETLEFHVSCVITWAKPNFAIGYGDYNQQTEFCLYGWKDNNGSHSWYGPTNESTLWEIRRDLTKNYIHPTQKPIAIPQRAILNSSRRGDSLLDLFLGSGSTLMAAENTGRRCFGMEIDPKYVDAVVRRYLAFTDGKNVSEEIKSRYQGASHA